MPRPIDPVLVDERQPASTDHLEVVPRDRASPPGLLDSPAVADLDGLPTAVPADRPDRAVRVQLDLDLGVSAEETGHRTVPASTGRHAQRLSASCASGSTTSTRRTRSSPKVR